MPAPHTREELLEALAQERAALLDVLPQFSAEQWHSATREDGWTAQDIAMHLADANYGLALMTLGEIEPPMKLDPETKWMAGLDEYNESRRAKNATLPSDKVLSRSAKALDEARRAMESVDDLDAPGPLGPAHTKRQWLQRIVGHTRMHRKDLE
ncbi:MAG TPA: DinB family protein, partial [Roseiflexaceae bacterium]|nr:DinB family protein [Roseiflexaceae bacterium]